MRSSFLVFLISAILACTVAANPFADVFSSLVIRKTHENKANSTGTPSVKSQCKQIKKLTKLQDLASNSTKMQEALAKSKNATKLQDQITASAAKLTTLSANSTLMNMCVTLAAEAKNSTKNGNKTHSGNSGSSTGTAGEAAAQATTSTTATAGAGMVTLAYSAMLLTALAGLASFAL